MDRIFKFPASPGTPLFPVSPERANRQQLPQSPSLPSLPSLSDPVTNSHVRAPSDVQGKVAQFNNLNKDAVQRRRNNEASLQRAVLGREEAESETRRIKEEMRILRKEIEEGRGRERRVGELLEALMEELQRTKEELQRTKEELERTKKDHAHLEILYKKEVRRAKREAFKASSHDLERQEELKTAQNRFTLMREEVEVQRRKVDSREKEAFVAQYQSVGLQEEVDKLNQKLKATEEERDALRTSLKAEEVARIAAEGNIPLPTSREPDEFSSPKKKIPAKQGILKEIDDDPIAVDDSESLAILRLAFDQEVRRRKEANDRIHFMKMECQFRCCPCRIAENRGAVFVHDNSAAEKIAAKVSDVGKEVQERSAERARDFGIKEIQTMPLPLDLPPSASTPEPLSIAVLMEAPNSPTTASTPRFREKSVLSTPQNPSNQEQNSLIQFSPTSGTFRTAQIPPIPSSPPGSPRVHDIPQTPTALLRFSPQFPTTKTVPVPIQGGDSPMASSPPKLRFPTTPRPLPIPPPHTTHMANSLTISIPLAAAPSPAPFTPSATMSREEALEQIRQRRGRARSIAAGHTTPRKQMVDLGGLRRDISAPAGRTG